MPGALPEPILDGAASRLARPMERQQVAFDRESGFMRLQLAGDLRVEDLESAFVELLAHVDFRAGMPVLWDLRAGTVAGLSAGDLRRFRLFVSARKMDRGAGRTAVVVANLIDYGLARMFELMAESLPTTLAVFREIDPAETWLLANRDI